LRKGRPVIISSASIGGRLLGSWFGD